MKRIIIIASTLLTLSSAWAQQPGKAPQVSKKATAERRTETRAGNNAYNHKRYDEANKHYNQALKADSTYYKAQYNLGNTLYRQGNYEQAGQCYSRALQNPSLKPAERSRIHYNLGNSELQKGLKEKQQGDPQHNGMEQFRNAVNNYQEALKIDPKNKDARYNLSYAMKMLQQAKNQQQQNQKNGGGQNNQQQQQQQQQKQGQGQQGQDKKQGQGDKDQQNQNQDPKNQKDDQGKGDPKQNQNKPPQQKPQDQQKKDQQKKQAEQLLNAVKNNEKQTMKEQQKAQEAKVDALIEKDW